MRSYVDSLKKEGKTNIPHSLRKPTMGFFFRNASPQAIDKDSNSSLYTLEKQYPDVSIWWGPNPLPQPKRT
jgi:hypothetical protein